MVRVGPSDTNHFPIWVRAGLCLDADLVLGWVVGQAQAGLLVHLGAVGWVSLA